MRVGMAIRGLATVVDSPEEAFQAHLLSAHADAAELSGIPLHLSGHSTFPLFVLTMLKTLTEVPRWSERSEKEKELSHRLLGLVERWRQECPADAWLTDSATIMCEIEALNSLGRTDAVRERFRLLRMVFDERLSSATEHDSTNHAQLREAQCLWQRLQLEGEEFESPPIQFTMTPVVARLCTHSLLKERRFILTTPQSVAAALPSFAKECQALLPQAATLGTAIVTRICRGGLADALVELNTYRQHTGNRSQPWTHEELVDTARAVLSWIDADVSEAAETEALSVVLLKVAALKLRVAFRLLRESLSNERLAIQNEMDERLRAGLLTRYDYWALAADPVLSAREYEQ